MCIRDRGWAIVFFYGHAYSLTVALIGGFMLLGPGLAMGLYGLSRQREAGEVPRLQPSLSIWRANLSNLGIFALVSGVVFLIWARASMVAFAVFYSSGLPTADDFLREILAFENVEFVIAYPVSYTHLDVYKRQGAGRRAGIRAFLCSGSGLDPTDRSGGDNAIAIAGAAVFAG